MQEIISFLSDIKANNNREWFNDHKKQYDQAKGQFIDIVERIISDMQSFEPLMGGIKAQQSIFRINRDVRFSKDKSPYKTNFAAYFNPEGKKSTKAGYYLQIEPQQSFVGGGVYTPSPEVLKSIRQEIDYNFADFKKIIENKGFRDVYPSIYEDDKLSRPPKDYDAQNPAIEFLKLKHYIYSHELSPTELKSQETLVKASVTAFKILKPFNDFLNQSLEV